MKYELVIRTVKTICDLVCSFPQKCDVVPDKKSEEWTESLVTFYIFSTLASDWHFLWDPYIRGMYIGTLGVLDIYYQYILEGGGFPGNDGKL